MLVSIGHAEQEDVMYIIHSLKGLEFVLIIKEVKFQSTKMYNIFVL